ncbi:MAG: ADOP family duplicated permease [Gemmatimonadales bacterium]
MRSLRTALTRLAGLFAGRGADEEARLELQSHLDMETAENVRRGMSVDQARRQALLVSGGLTQGVEAVHDRRGVPWIEEVVADLKYATRALRRTPGFTAVVVITLALGIGANTAIFSVVRGVLLKPLPHRDGDRLVYLRHSLDGPGGENTLFSVPEIQDYRDGAKAFSGIAEYSPLPVTLQLHDQAVVINLGLVTGNYFDVMGLSPILGRVTRPSDDGPGVPPVMVLTHEYWESHFGGDPGIVGKQVLVNGQSATVIGVLQAAPTFPTRMDALMNMVISKHHTSAQMVQGRTHRMTEMIARLAPGATLAQAKAEVAMVTARVQREYPAAYDPGSHFRVTVIPFKQALGERAALTLWLLMGAAAFVMIISAANVTNLTLMRGVRREQEMVVRASLGAGTARLRRLLLAENLVLTLVGAALGVVLAIGGVRLLTSLAARYSPRADEIRLDGVVLTFALTLAALIALLLSFLAALPREGSFAARISAGVHRMSGGLRKQRLQRALVVAQIAVSVVLLAGAGLLTRTMLELSAVSTGLQTDQVLTMQASIVPFDQLNATTDAAAKEQYSRMRTEIAALPGVVDVGIGAGIPLQPVQGQLDVKAEGQTLAVGEAQPSAEFRGADPTFFHAAGIPLIKGRTFLTTDRQGSGLVAIVNQAFVDKFFPHQDPIGKRIAWTGDVLRFVPISGDWRTIVGVVGNTRDAGPDAQPPLEMFTPFAQELSMQGASLAIRTRGDAAAIIPAATRIVRRIAPTTPIENLMTIAQIKDESVAPRRLNAVLISSFGLLALLIAAVGIAGVLGFAVSTRTNEIGIRMSLGADSGQVQRMILREGGVLLVLGLGLGAAGAMAATGLIRGLLFGVAPHDPATFISVVVMMAAIGLGACWIPARRAARIDPAIAMRPS